MWFNLGKMGKRSPKLGEESLEDSKKKAQRARGKPHPDQSRNIKGSARGR